VGRYRGKQGEDVPITARPPAGKQTHKERRRPGWVYKLCVSREIDDDAGEINKNENIGPRPGGGLLRKSRNPRHSSDEKGLMNTIKKARKTRLSASSLGPKSSCQGWPWFPHRQVRDPEKKCTAGAVKDGKWGNDKELSRVGGGPNKYTKKRPKFGVLS